MSIRRGLFCPARFARAPASSLILLLLQLGGVAVADEAASASSAGTDASLAQRVRDLEQKLGELSVQLKPATPVPSLSLSSPSQAATAEPFSWGDFTWLNGASRQAHRLLDTRYFTPQIDIDLNYTYSFNRPIDHTVVGSTSLARNNELEVNYAAAGGDLHIGNVRGRLLLQYGTRSTVVPRNDNSVLRGQFDLATVYRYVSEAYAGYHFNRLHGINVDAGLFFSYVGLFSYTNFENWAYQPSFTSDNTPWFFNGLRIQIFPADRLKVELWVINGWQTYGKFNELPGVGYQIHYSPQEWMKVVFNGYVGTDTQEHPSRVRFHSDNSFLLRYYDRPGSKGLSRAAFSVTFDVGFEQGDGVAAFHGSGTEGNCTRTTPCEQDFVSGMAYNRLWFWRNRLGWTVGGGFIHNPGRYLVLVPPGVAATTFSTNPGTRFDGWDVSTTFDWLATEHVTFRAELVHREASVPYFAGRGGVTGPSGYKSGGLGSPDGVISTNVPGGWQPDLVHAESRFILAVLLRI